MLADRVRMGVQSEGGYTITIQTFGNFGNMQGGNIAYSINDGEFVVFEGEPERLWEFENVRSVSFKFLRVPSVHSTIRVNNLTDDVSYIPDNIGAIFSITVETDMDFQAVASYNIN